MVALHVASGHLQAGDEAEGETGLFVEGKEVLEEALEIVRTQAAGPAGGRREKDELTGEFIDSRTQLRINTSVPIKVLCAQHARPVDARLDNISWGGAAFVIDEEFKIDEELKVILPRPQGGSISIEARILRTWVREDGNGVSVRFSSLGTRDEAKLESILEHLVQKQEDEGQRMHARLAQRLDIEFDGIQELESTLDDISAGGLRITVPDALPVGQSLQTVISTLDGKCSLKLRARVVRQKPVKLQAGEFYHVGLKFEHPTEELNKRVRELIARAATTKNT